MADTGTSRLGLMKLEQYSRDNTWGPVFNIGALERIDEAFGTSEIPVGANITLTAYDFIENQARSMVLVATGAGGFTVTHPAVGKPYLVANRCLADIVLKPNGGTGATIRAGSTVWYHTDAAGTAGFAVDPTLDTFRPPVANVAMNNKKLTGLAAGTNPGDAVNRAQLDTIAGSTEAAVGAAGTAVAAAGVATVKAQEAAQSAQSALEDANRAEAAVGSIANGPVVSVNGFTGIVNLTAENLGITDALQARSEKNQPGGYAGLGGDGKVPAGLLALATDVVLDTYTASGTFTKEADDIAYFVECVGGGGGGGAAGINTTSRGGGGAGGGYGSRWVLPIVLDLATTVVVGAGGSPGIGGNTITPGGAGGNSSFGSMALGIGGGGGLSGSPATPSIGGSSIDAGPGQSGYASGGGGYSGAVGDSVMGGAGGGYGGPSAQGGVSACAGAGGAGAGTSSSGGVGSNGNAPGGGGGGGTYGSGSAGGSGARGEVRVYRFKK